jgi:hypothetical protein
MQYVSFAGPGTAIDRQMFQMEPMGGAGMLITPPFSTSDLSPHLDSSGAYGMMGCAQVYPTQMGWQSENAHARKSHVRQIS